MHDPWLPEREPGGDEFEELFAPGWEAWRGDVHPAEGAAANDRDDLLGPHGEPWRGDLHLADWPEEAAGPEYVLFKKWGLSPADLG